MKATKLFFVAAICMVAFCSCENGPDKEEEEKTEFDSEDSGEENGDATESTSYQWTVSGTHNGHDYVDLGLPSGTLWATCNVGANAPEDYGNHYAWGETETKSDYTWETYKYANGDYNKLTKYCWRSDYGNDGFSDNKTVLDLTDDAARANWGGYWRMPGNNEYGELMDGGICTWTWTTRNGVVGYNVRGPNGNSIFLPAAGYRDGTELKFPGNEGLYWSRSGGSYTVEGVYFYSGSYSGSGTFNNTPLNYRYYGQSVRPVCARNSGATDPDPTGWENGYAYVDMGLHRGTMWATCNIGASAPEEYGNYYAWGETETKSDYTWATYKYANGASDKLTKYCPYSKYGNNGFSDDKAVLDLTDDAAHVNWGGKWRMPTNDEVNELFCLCTETWIIRNGVEGYDVKAPNGNSIFLPTAGYRNGTELNGAGYMGFCWLNSLRSNTPCNAHYIGIGPAWYGSGEESRCIGIPIRPVCEK